MSSRFPEYLLALPLLVFALGSSSTPTSAHDAPPLRICADPNNLPFSNAKGEGFENRIAELLGREMQRPVEYSWWASRRGYVRNTLKAGLCDVLVGVPTSFEPVATTRPYYRSTYVFVTRRGGPRLATLDDTALRHLRIGVHLAGDDGANTPPLHALTKRGVIDNVVGYTLYGDYARANPTSRILDALVAKQLDVAIVWGPLGGWYASHSRTPLTLVPVYPQIDLPYLPFVFDISMGVRRGDDSLRVQLDRAMRHRRADVDRILASYGVPRVDAASAGGAR
ncbi:MAG: extracellular solute-binding protein family 3 [Gemmatimonadetes bacterium]|nr:extracellular solute-binding protein family 3 [Gemmatimonadota bacterium]